MTLAEFGEQPAALDAGELPIVAGQDQFCPRLPGFGQQLAGDPGVEHRRLVHDEDGVPVPLRPPVLQREQRRVHRARLSETVCLQVLRHSIGRRQADRPLPAEAVRVADRRKGKTLAGAGAAGR